MTLDDRVAQAYADSRDDVYRYLVLLGLAPPQAQDIAQDSFLRLYQAMRKGDLVENPRGWVFRVAHNLAMNALTRHNRDRPLDAVPDGRLRDRAMSAEEQLIEREKMERVQEALGELSPQQRRCLYLRAEGMRYREIAEIIGVGVSTVGEFLSRAMSRLQKAVQ